MKKIEHLFKILNFGLFKKNFRLSTKTVKIVCSLIFPKCLVALSKECTWQGLKFSVLSNFTTLFTLFLIFIRVWPKEDLLFEITQTTQII